MKLFVSAYSCIENVTHLDIKLTEEVGGGVQAIMHHLKIDFKQITFMNQQDYNHHALAHKEAFKDHNYFVKYIIFHIMSRNSSSYL